MNKKHAVIIAFFGVVGGMCSYIFISGFSDEKSINVVLHDQKISDSPKKIEYNIQVDVKILRRACSILSQFSHSSPPTCPFNQIKLNDLPWSKAVLPNDAKYNSAGVELLIGCEAIDSNSGNVYVLSPGADGLLETSDDLKKGCFVVR